MRLKVNGQEVEAAAEEDMPLLWVLRDVLKLNGTKFGCGAAACGACTIHLDGRAVRSCVTPASMAAGASITTIEGLAADGRLSVLQQAWIDHQVPQCGYCQTGMLMAAGALLAERAKPTDAEIDLAITNICRCGTYARIRAAIHDAAAKLAAGGRT